MINTKNFFRHWNVILDNAIGENVSVEILVAIFLIKFNIMIIQKVKFGEIAKN